MPRSCAPVSDSRAVSVCDVARHAVLVIDRPKDRQYLGPCPQCNADLECEHGAAWVVCERAGDVDELMAEWLSDGTLLTESELVGALVMGDRQGTRGQIRGWERRGFLLQTRDGEFGEFVQSQRPSQQRSIKGIGPDPIPVRPVEVSRFEEASALWSSDVCLRRSSGRGRAGIVAESGNPIAQVARVLSSERRRFSRRAVLGRV